jgi:hypothetical protein
LLEYVRPEWVSFVAAACIVGESAALSQLVAAPWNAVCGGFAVTGGLILGAFIPRRIRRRAPTTSA